MRWDVTILIWFACASCSGPTRPSASVVGAHPSSFEAQPALPFYRQPIVLAVTGSLQTGADPLSSVVEVATDRGFGAIVQTKPLPPQVGGSIAVALNHLDGDQTYYWRVHTTGRNGIDVMSATATFSIGPPLVLAAPVPIEPLANSFPGSRPSFTIRNATRRGPEADISYRLEVAQEVTFTAPIGGGSMTEQATQTKFVSDVVLAPGVTYYWRSQAIADEYDVHGPWSEPQSFTTFFPGEGQFPYRLILRTGPTCAGVLGSGFCGHGYPWPNPDLSFDGTLISDGSTLELTLPPVPVPHGSAPVFRFARTGADVTGTVIGSTPERVTGFYATFGRGLLSEPLRLADDLTGHSDNRGRWDGTLAGSLQLYRPFITCEVTWRCSTAALTWTLLPR